MGFEVAHSSNRQFGFCCGEVTTKCAQGCAGKSCDIQCSGTCGFLNSQCGPYTCSAVTNACVSSSDTAPTTEATTTTVTTTTTSTTTTTTAAAPCAGAGTLCLSLTEGQVATCCTGTSCSTPASGGGYNCA